VVNRQGGNDSFSATTLAAGIVQLTIDSGAGDDRVLGSQGADVILGGDGNDFVLGDNGTLRRNTAGGTYATYPGDGGHDRLQRLATRLDVGVGGGVSGGDTIRGNAGDDAVWGQDGSDAIYGGTGDDDLLGELGGDAIYGGTGEDAVIGDRGGIRNTVLGSTGAQFAAPQFTFSPSGPPFVTWVVRWACPSRASTPWWRWSRRTWASS